ncbi:MAG: aminotransferase class I/II-fold pyridoxal phosphate-dependent enzyme [Erysipelotrichaceae bacterium]|nr:aminotransferase class I/II-fold pyridoxal phosphate-dependent enzyme [Erysipelotrichaceae bacterium]
MMTDLKDLRNQLDDIDAQLRDLFIRRMETVDKVAAYKKENSLPILDSKRESEIISSNLSQVEEKWQESYLSFQRNLLEISRLHQSSVTAESEPLLNDSADFSAFVDNAFKAGADARNDPDCLANATIGSLHDEQGSIITFRSVYDTYECIPDSRRATYASRIEGNEDFNEAVYRWINRLDNLHLPHRLIATPGGTGALYLPVSNCLNRGDALLIPEICWGTYRIMAARSGLNTETYGLFAQGQPSIDSLKEKAALIMKRQKRLAVIINDPCHNPTGASLGKENWKQLISFFNELAVVGPVMIINDVAYLDYAYDWKNATDYMEAFNGINDNVAICITFSCSKSLTAYGMRLGNCIILAHRQQQADHLFNCFCRSARGTWSNVNNGFMDAFVLLMKDHQDEYLQEKQQAIDLLKARSQLFISNAQRVGLPLVPYQEGFFICLDIEPDIIDRYYQALKDAHIYCVHFRKAIRVAICSLRISQIAGLAQRMKQVLDEVRSQTSK